MRNIAWDWEAVIPFLNSAAAVDTGRLLGFTQMNINLNQAKFMVAAHKPAQWMPDNGREVAFAGRSNSGKSSAINAITGRKSLAITSKTPGRTQQIVFFEVLPAARLVDLPGYGYSKVPKQLRNHWSKVIEQYFATRRSLHALILMMDIRHPLKPVDLQLVRWCQASEVATHILLTKADKLSKSRISATIAQVESQCEDLDRLSVQAFSARSGMGVPQARQRVSELLVQS